MGLHDNPEYLRLTRKFLKKTVRVKSEAQHKHAGEEGQVVAIDSIHDNLLIKVKGKYEDFYIDNEKDLVTI